MQKRDVMFFLPQLGGGGAEMNAVRVGSALYSCGHKVSFAVCRGGGNYEEMVPDGIPVYHLPTGRIRSSSLRLVRSIGCLRKLLLEVRPEILCPVMDGPAVAAIRAVARIRRKPRVVISVQVSPLSQFVARGGFVEKLFVQAMRKAYPHADHVIALSEGVAQEVVALVPALEGKVSVVHNAGVSPDATRHFEDERVRSPWDKGKVIVACGRLTEQKGYPYLLKAFARVRESEDATLWVLGDGPLRRKLEQLARYLGIRGQVRFFGFRSNAQAYMRVADVFVLASLWEGFGNVIVEAMAVGTPVVSTDCPHGPAEIIKNGKNGLLVEPKDSEALANALVQVLSDNNLRTRLTEAGLRRAADFAPDRIAAQYADTFNRILGVV